MYLSSKLLKAKTDRFSRYSGKAKEIKINYFFNVIYTGILEWWWFYNIVNILKIHIYGYTDLPSYLFVLVGDLCGDLKTTSRNRFCISTTWILGIKFRFSGLVASTYNCEPSSWVLIYTFLKELWYINYITILKDCVK